MDIPSNSERVSNVEHLSEYFIAGLKMIHVAVKRSLNYYHHYVILAEDSTWNTYLKIVHYTAGPSHFISGSTCGTVEEINMSISQVEEDICDGMYVISGTNYPQEAIDFVKACSRYLLRLGEKAYHLVYNNCEHLANYIMTGYPKSEQITQSCPLKKAVADTFDMAGSDGKSNFVKSAINSSGSALAARKFISTACSKVFTAAQFMIPNTSTRNVASFVAQKIIKYTARSYPSVCSTEQMLCSETCCEVAETAGKSAFKKTFIATGVLTFAVEAGFAAWQIHNLGIMKKEGKIQERDYEREKTKAIVTVPVVTALTVAGSVIGQVVCPVPFVGAFFGGLIGSYFGRIGASVGTGRIFDWWWP